MNYNLKTVFISIFLLISALFAMAQAPDKLMLDCNNLGHIYLLSETIEIICSTDAGNVRWTLCDSLGKSRPLIENNSKLSLPAKELGPGYYRLTADVDKDGKTVSTGQIPLAVIPVQDINKMPNNPFGVMTHFAQGWNTDILPLIAKAGIGNIRDEHYWKNIEQQKGKYAFSEQDDSYMDAAKKLGIEPLIIMSFNNPIYDEGHTPYTPAGCDAFGRYGAAIATHYPSIKTLEVWNEYNGSWCDGPAATDRPKYYTQMLQHSYQQIKKRHPTVKVLGGASVLIPKQYLEGIFQHDGLKYMDAIAVHPYRGAPEGVEVEITELKTLMGKYNNGKALPIWTTESGVGDKSEGPDEVGLRRYDKGRMNVASYLTRQTTLLMATGVEKSYWYLTRDYNDFITMGLLRGPDDPEGKYAVSPAYCAYATTIHNLYGAKFLRREPSQKSTRVYLFTKNGKEIRVCWAIHPTEIRLSSSGPIIRTDMCGEVSNPDSKVKLTLNERPVFLTSKPAKFAEIPPAERILTDSRDDFSQTQGLNGWYYGWTDNQGTNYQPMTSTETQWDVRWAGKAPYQSVQKEGMHPGVQDGKPLQTVRRWKSDIAGKVKIEGAFNKDKQGDGVDGIIRINGQELFHKRVGGPGNPEKAEFNLTAIVKVGSEVDFLVTPGPGLDTSYDYTGFFVAISKIK